jgi:hypothetical protein
VRDIGDSGSINCELSDLTVCLEDDINVAGFMPLLTGNGIASGSLLAPALVDVEEGLELPLGVGIPLISRTSPFIFSVVSPFTNPNSCVPFGLPPLTLDLSSTNTSRTSTHTLGKIPENTLASKVCPFTLVKPASKLGGATKYPLYHSPSLPPCSMMYNSSPISRGRSAGDEGENGYVHTPNAIRGNGRQGIVAPVLAMMLPSAKGEHYAIFKPMSGARKMRVKSYMYGINLLLRL